MKKINKRLRKHKKTQNAQIFDNAILTWKAPEYVYHEKTMLWFIIAGLILFALIVYGFKTDSWTFSLAAIMLACTYYLFHAKKPSLVDVKISKFGIKIGHHIFPYNHIRAFWIVYEAKCQKKLYLKIASAFHPHVIVLLSNTNPAEVRHLLLSHLEEIKGQTEPLSDTITRLLKL